MNEVLSPSRKAERFSTGDQRWRAVATRDRSADSAFVYSVKTTGVYCRPTCAARLAKRKNVAFYSSASAAERAGFRACKRCNPAGISPKSRHSALIAKACQSIQDSDKPILLDHLAARAGMSPWHFLRVFKAVTGVTPKAYSSEHRTQRIRKQLNGPGTVTSTIYRSGFNSNGTFYAESKKRLGMKPMNYKKGGKGIVIQFAVGDCSMGSILAAGSPNGLCAIALGNDPDLLVQQLQDWFPNAELIGGDLSFETTVARVIAFVETPAAGLDLPLDVQGTAFQQRVWKALSEIPFGETRSYSQIATRIGHPTATRAVAGACGSNKLAVVIPCHRVVRTDGSLSGYRWGVERKAKLLKAENHDCKQSGLKLRLNISIPHVR